MNSVLESDEPPEVSYRRLPKNLREERPPSGFNILTASGESALTKMDYESDVFSRKGESLPIG